MKPIVSDLAGGIAVTFGIVGAGGTIIVEGRTVDETVVMGEFDLLTAVGVPALGVRATLVGVAGTALEQATNNKSNTGKSKLNFLSIFFFHITSKYFKSII